MLPEIRKTKPLDIFTPQKWQTFILRNYGLVTKEKMAEVLGTDAETVEREAKRLGLDGVKYSKRWMELGYITVLRNNWHLLPYQQIMTLLDMSEAELEYNLKEDDFLDVKLGNFKPYAEPLVYAPLTEAEMKQTEKIAEIVRENFIPDYTAPFEFSYEKGVSELQTVQTDDGEFLKIIYGYSMLYGDTLLTGEDPISDGLLKKLAAVGVNGIWFQGVLSKLSYYPFVEGVSDGYEIRRKNLKKLIEKCAKYGIKIYLYMNEPRSLFPNQFTEKTESLKGWLFNGQYSLCTSTKEVQDYLYNAVKDFTASVPGLGGIITITMSENFTNCYSWKGCVCPRCSKRSCADVVPEVNNIFMRAIRDGGSGARLIANLWGWSPFMDWTERQTMRGIELLDEEISLMFVSEYDLAIEKGGVKSRIIDYSLGNPGPREISKKIREKGRATGHKIYAKIQINDSWECSAVPYLPVFDLVYEHLKNLNGYGVRDFMLTWTLGGYPSPMTDLVADFIEEGENFSLDKWYQRQFGEHADKMQSAVGYFSRAFAEFPFSIDSLYYSPKTLGAANLWSLAPDGKKSCMVCYAYDDYESWISPYPYDVYVRQYEKLLTLWEKGIALLAGGEGREKEVAVYAEAAYLHFKADLLQTKFAFYKREKGKYTAEIERVLQEEKALIERLLAIVSAYPTVGYEASNHYFYHESNIY